MLIFIPRCSYSMFNIDECSSKRIPDLSEVTYRHNLFISTSVHFKIRYAPGQGTLIKTWISIIFWLSISFIYKNAIKNGVSQVFQMGSDNAVWQVEMVETNCGECDIIWNNSIMWPCLILHGDYV